MPACNLRFGAMATCFRRNEIEIKDITLDGVIANRNVATSPSRRVVSSNGKTAVVRNESNRF